MKNLMVSNVNNNNGCLFVPKYQSNVVEYFQYNQLLNMNGMSVVQGARRINDGSIQEGLFVNDELTGEGTLYYQNGAIMYKGNFLNGLAHGSGVAYYQDGTIRYEGEFKNGKFDGKGKCYWNGCIYEGNMFSNGSITGYGCMTDSNSIRYYGNFTNGMLNGHVTFYLPGGCRFTTFSIRGIFNGKCYKYDPFNNLIECFHYLNGRIEGIGIEYRYDIYGNRSKCEFRAFNDVKYPIESFNSNQSIYWDVMYTPFPINNGAKRLDSWKSYQLMLDVLSHIATERVDILSPWIGRYVAEDPAFISAMDRALRRGVNVNIVTGLEGERKITTDMYINSLSERFKNHIGKLSFYTRNSHEKYLICDTDFLLEGSHNLLSYKPNHKDTRLESMSYNTDLIKIFSIRNESFNF